MNETIQRENTPSALKKPVFTVASDSLKETLLIPELPSKIATVAQAIAHIESAQWIQDILKNVAILASDDGGETLMRITRNKQASDVDGYEAHEWEPIDGQRYMHVWVQSYQSKALQGRQN